MSILPATDDPDTAEFWTAAKQGRLLVQSCGGHLRFPPHPSANSTNWMEVSGRGKIYSFIVVHAPTLPSFADRIPFPVALVELDEDPNLRMVGNLLAEPGASWNSLGADEIHVGQKVRVSFEPTDEDDVVLPCWVPE